MNGSDTQKRTLFILLLILNIIIFCIILILITDSNDPTSHWTTVNDEMTMALNSTGQEDEGTPSSTGENHSSIETVETTPNGPININHAEASELESLPGIGPVKAKAIIEYRNHFGPFQSKEDLLKVKGIGPKTFERLESHIVVQ